VAAVPTAIDPFVIGIVLPQTNNNTSASSSKMLNVIVLVASACIPFNDVETTA
jgi:hypothetical protein